MVDQTVTIGIDESGILSSIGPRPQVGIASFLIKDEIGLKKIELKGKDHFRRLKDENDRQAIIKVIKEKAVLCETQAIEHRLLDEYLSRGLKRYQAECLILEDVAVNAAARVSEQGFHVERIVIDKVKKILKPTQYYFDGRAKEAIEKATGTNVIVTEEADKIYFECLAAWIIAFNAFKLEQVIARKTFGKIGSGHPADKQTNMWLREHYAGCRNFDSIPHQAEATPIRNFANRVFHVVDTRWRTPADVRDMGRGLSSPYLVLKDVFGDPNGHDLEYVNLRRNIELNIAIYEKRCPGIWENFVYKPCTYIDSYGVKGMPLGKWQEKCFDCRRESPPIKCLFNPDCDGYEARCGFKGFGASFCGSLHANYLTCCGNTIKVGQTLYNNIGQRLLEQGPAFAFVYAISPNRQIAREFEVSSANVLKDNAEVLNYLGINQVRQTSPKTEIVLADFVENWDGVGTKKHLLDIFSGLTYAPEIKDRLLDLPIELDLLNDYKKPNNLSYDKKDLSYLQGKIVGFRGHFIYVERKDETFVVDLDSIKYHIIKGEIKYDD